MKTRSEVTAEKLRGGFYTPSQLALRCLERVDALAQGDQLKVLEPSAGDGAFFRVLAEHRLRNRVGATLAIEPEEGEAARCSEAQALIGQNAQTLVESCLKWGLETDEQFDVAFGNPPFVRFQFVRADDRSHATEIGDALGVSFRGVSNLWIPVLLASLSRLKPGGAFAFVVPSECFTGVSAGHAREWLLANTQDLLVDLFPPESFPGVLQEVVIISGRRAPEAAEQSSISIQDHDGSATVVTHPAPADGRSWTRYLLDPAHLSAFEEAESLTSVSRLGTIARFEVATVTGANGFFSVDDATLNEFDLEQWALPLLPRIRHASGLVYGLDDHAATIREGARGHLLSFADGAGDPQGADGPSAYLDIGISQGLPSRYKCRIREPWYRVPVVAPGALLLTKRSHRFPRMVLNDARVVTTDTIYRGSVLNGLPPAAIVAGFHNSMTLLSVELSGRSFGGGVLELVPSEIAQVSVPTQKDLSEELPSLDATLRDSVTPEELVTATDNLLAERVAGLDRDLLASLADGRRVLLERRLDRNRSATTN